MTDKSRPRGKHASRKQDFILTMFGVSVFFIVLLANFAAKTMSTEQREIKNMSSFIQKHLKLANLLHVQSISVYSQGAHTMNYTLGGHVTGERIVAQSADTTNYDGQKDVSIQLTYPESGTSAILTYVEITCTQDNNDGNAYVIAGSIGQSYISIVLEAIQTQNFSYQAQYYGID